MDNQQAVVDQIVQNLAFEVEAVPRKKSTRSSSISQSTPLNVKIKVRKKDDKLIQHISTQSDDTGAIAQKVRLVSSDRTIMKFDVFMEAEFEKRPPRKFHKQVFDKLRPGICLGPSDDDEYVYMPSSSYSANITAPTATRSDGTLKQTFTLSKNMYQTDTVQDEPVQKWLFGKCKRGGCLDPPFSEDTYSYKPSTRSGPERHEINTEPKTSKPEVKNTDSVECDVSEVHDEDPKTENKRSSFFEGGFFKRKRKSSDKSTSTLDKTDSISKLGQVESPKRSVSRDSDSIITYPPKISSDLRISDDKTNRSKAPSEDRSRRSFNDFHSEPYFIPPKGTKERRIKETDTLNQKDSANRRSSEVSESKTNGKESIKIPIPIPIIIPNISGKVKPKDTKKNDALPTQDEDEVDEIVTPDEELKEISNLRPENRPLKLENVNPANVQQPVTSLSDNNSLDIKPQPYEKKDSENDTKEMNQIVEKNASNQKHPLKPSDVSKPKIDGKDSIKIPIPIPIPISTPMTRDELGPKDTLKYDTLPKQDENAENNILTPDEEFKEILDLRPEQVTEAIENKPYILENEAVANDQQPAMSPSDSNLLDIKPQKYLEKDSKKDIEKISPILEKDASNKKPSSKHRSSDVSKSKIDGKDSVEMPIPIPIPITIPVISNEIEPKDQKYDTLPKQDKNAVDKFITPDKELKEIVDLRPEFVTEPIENKPVDQQPVMSLSDSSSLDIKPQQGEEKYSEKDIKNHPIIEKDASNQKTSAKHIPPDDSKSKIDGEGSIKIPIPIPILVTIPVTSNEIEPKDSKKYDILPKQDKTAGDKIVTPDEELKEILDSRPESITAAVENRPIILENEVLADVELPVMSPSGSISSDIKPQSEEKQDRENVIKDIVKLNEETGIIPIPVIVKRNGDSGTKLSETTSSKNSLPYVPPYSDEKAGPNSNKYLRTNDTIDEENSQSDTPLSKVPTIKDNIESESQIKQVTKQIIKPDDDDPRDFKTEDNISTLPSLKEEEEDNISTIPIFKETDNVSNLSSLKKEDNISSLPSLKDDINQSYEDPNTNTIYPTEAGRETQTATDKDFHEVKKVGDINISYKKDRIEKPLLSKTEDKMTLIEKEIPRSSLSEIPKFPRKDENASYITILSDNTETSKNVGQVKRVINETGIFDIPMTDRIDQTKNVAIPSSASDEFIGPQTVMYLDKIPPASSGNNYERVPSLDKHVLLDTGMGGLEIMQKPSKTFDEAGFESSTASTSTLKSVLKKDVMSVEFGFHSFVNDKNARVLRTFDTAAAPTRYPNDSIAVIKSQIRISSNEIRIPVDSDHDLSIQIKKANANQRVSISDSGFITVDSDRSTSRRSPTQGYARSANLQEQKKMQSDVPDISVIDLYERELMPLQTIIKNLRDEIDVLAAQQTTFKDKMICPHKSKLPRLIHTHKKCIGCVKK